MNQPCLSLIVGEKISIQVRSQDGLPIMSTGLKLAVHLIKLVA